jgi:hypothetical protein
MGSIMIEENVVSAAGANTCANERDLRYQIREAGFIPQQRDIPLQLHQPRRCRRSRQERFAEVEAVECCVRGYEGERGDDALRAK